MLLSESDVMKIVLAGTAGIHVRAEFAKLTGTTPSQEAIALSLASAATTSINTAPGGGVLQRLAYFNAINVHASNTNTIDILVHNGTSDFYVKKGLILAPGECLEYSGRWDVIERNGSRKVAQYANAGTPWTSNFSTVVLASDVTNNNAVANTMQDVTGLSFPVLANKLYEFEFMALYTAAATTTGSRWSINGPASPTRLSYTSEYTLTSTTTTRNAELQAYDQPAASNATSGSTGNNKAVIYGMIRPSANGNVIMRFASEVSSSAIVALAGSRVLYRQLD